MVDTLGWLNLSFIALMITIYPMKKLYSKYRKSNMLNIYKKSRLIHPLLGFIIIIIGLIHGYIALGTIKLHTGVFVLITIILMGFITVLGKKRLIFTKTWIKIHKGLVPILLIFLFIHLFYRSLI